MKRSELVWHENALKNSDSENIAAYISCRWPLDKIEKKYNNFSLICLSIICIYPWVAIFTAIIYEKDIKDILGISPKESIFGYVILLFFVLALVFYLVKARHTFVHAFWIYGRAVYLFDKSENVKRVVLEKKKIIEKRKQLYQQHTPQNMPPEPESGN